MPDLSIDMDGYRRLRRRRDVRAQLDDWMSAAGLNGERVQKLTVIDDATVECQCIDLEATREVHRTDPDAPRVMVTKRFTVSAPPPLAIFEEANRARP